MLFIAGMLIRGKFAILLGKSSKTKANFDFDHTYRNRISAFKLKKLLSITGKFLEYNECCFNFHFMDLLKSLDCYLNSTLSYRRDGRIRKINFPSHTCSLYSELQVWQPNYKGTLENLCQCHFKIIQLFREIMD